MGRTPGSRLGVKARAATRVPGQMGISQQQTTGTANYTVWAFSVNVPGRRQILADLSRVSVATPRDALSMAHRAEPCGINGLRRVPDIDEVMLYYGRESGPRFPIPSRADSWKNIMPVRRCQNCCRGRAGYLDGEKTLLDLTLPEIRTEIARYEAKETRIRHYIAGLQAGTGARALYPDGVACPRCGLGWREFADRRKDLEQLEIGEAITALGSNTRWLKKLRRQFEVIADA